MGRQSLMTLNEIYPVGIPFEYSDVEIVFSNDKFERISFHLHRVILMKYDYFSGLFRQHPKTKIFELKIDDFNIELRDFEKALLLLYGKPLKITDNLVSLMAIASFLQAWPLFKICLTHIKTCELDESSLRQIVCCIEYDFLDGLKEYLVGFFKWRMCDYTRLIPDLPQTLVDALNPKDMFFPDVIPEKFLVKTQEELYPLNVANISPHSYEEDYLGWKRCMILYMRKHVTFTIRGVEFDIELLDDSRLGLTIGKRYKRELFMRGAFRFYVEKEIVKEFTMEIRPHTEYCVWSWLDHPFCTKASGKGEFATPVKTMFVVNYFSDEIDDRFDHDQEEIFWG